MRAKLSDSSIAAFVLPKGKSDVLLWDEAVPGLALRVGLQRRAWVYVFRPRGAGRKANPQKVGLGAWPSVKVKAAREAAQIEAARVARGEDPAAARREIKRKDVSRLSAVLDAYEAHLTRRRYAAVKNAMSVLRRNLAPLADRDIATITRNEFVRRVEKLEEAELAGAAADLRKHARTLLEWTTNQGTTPFNVLAGLRRPKATRAQRLEIEERGRALSDADIRAVWRAAPADTVFGRYLRALILTGARRTEISRMAWSMVRPDRIVIPPSHTKQGRPHEIPLVPALADIVAHCDRMSKGLVFASPKSGGEMSGWTTLIGKVRKASNVSFTLHDLRRTFRSGLTRLGVDHDVAELMLAHQRDDLVRRYDKEQRWAERVEAAERWASHVLACAAVDVATVLPIRRAS